LHGAEGAAAECKRATEIFIREDELRTFRRPVLPAVCGLSGKYFWKVNFFKLSNLFNVTRAFSILGVVSLGQTMVILSGGLDLSVGSVISTSDVVAAGF
jgi:ribose/xylose/arabinose/galactoside ABC-type transport system permease subunit